MGQYRIERIALAGLAHAVRDGQQVQVVVAQHALGGIPEGRQALQHGERLRAAVHEVAQEVDAVARWGEVDGGEEVVQRVAAALEVAYQLIHDPILLRSRALALPRPHIPRWTSPYYFS